MFVAPCPWCVAGPLLGVLIIISLRVAVNKPLGALGGYIDLADRAAARRVMGFNGLLLIGTVLGGLIYSALWDVCVDNRLRHWNRSPRSEPARTVWSMGASWRRDRGRCSHGRRMHIGHGLCGVSLGSRASLVATMTFFGTAVLLSQVMAWALGGGR